MRHTKIALVVSLVLLFVSGPAEANSYSHCRAEKSPLWSQAESLIIESKSDSRRAQEMFVQNLAGWRALLRKAGETSRKGYDLKMQARREALQCRMNVDRANFDTKRERTLSEKLQDEAKRRVLREVRSKYPKLSKHYNFGKTQWNLFENKGDADATLTNVSRSVTQLRGLPTQPLSPAWSLSGSLLRVSLEDYQSVVKDSLHELEASLKKSDTYISSYLSSLAKRVSRRGASERKWKKWKEPFPSVASRRSPSRQGNSNAFINGFIQGLAGAAAVYGATRSYSGSSTRTRRAPSGKKTVPRRYPSGGRGRCTDGEYINCR